MIEITIHFVVTAFSVLEIEENNKLISFKISRIHQDLMKTHHTHFRMKESTIVVRAVWIKLANRFGWSDSQRLVILNRNN